jgi:hypothetical protein
MSMIFIKKHQNLRWKMVCDNYDATKPFIIYKGE